MGSSVDPPPDFGQQHSWRGCGLIVLGFLLMLIGSYLYYAQSARADAPDHHPAAIVYEPYVAPSHLPRSQQPQPRPSPGIERVPDVRKATQPSGGFSIRGKASWYASWCNCNAMTDQRWRGKYVTITGPIGTRRVLINDAGPVKRLHRVADLNPTVFKAVCGPLSKGICTVTITGP